MSSAAARNQALLSNTLEVAVAPFPDICSQLRERRDRTQADLARQLDQAENEG